MNKIVTNSLITDKNDLLSFPYLFNICISFPDRLLDQM